MAYQWRWFVERRLILTAATYNCSLYRKVISLKVEYAIFYFFITYD